MEKKFVVQISLIVLIAIFMVAFSVFVLYGDRGIKTGTSNNTEISNTNILQDMFAR